MLRVTAHLGRLPPAESPSTMKISVLEGSLFPAVGQLAGHTAGFQRPLLRRTRSRAFRAASRARAPEWPSRRWPWPRPGFSSREFLQLVVDHAGKPGCALRCCPALPWSGPANWASVKRRRPTTQVRPSRTSLPVRFVILVLQYSPFHRPKSLITRVRACLKPS